MWALLVAALAALPANDSSEAPLAGAGELRAADVRLAINPNISIGRCSGGEPIELSHGMPTRTYRGTLSGDIDGERAFGQYCTGYYRHDAQFCISVPSPGGYFTFEITDAEGADTTLAVVGDNVDWPYCDDDGAGRDLLSKLVQWYEPGEYLVYVGSFSQGVQAQFTLTASAGENW